MLRFFEKKTALLTICSLFTVALAWNTVQGASAAIPDHRLTNGITVAHGPTFPPDPWEGVRVAHGPTFPPDPWEGVRVAHGPTFPPDPWEGVLLAHGPTFPPDPWEGARIA
jgi:hypothetical protein